MKGGNFKAFILAAQPFWLTCPLSASPPPCSAFPRFLILNSWSIQFFSSSNYSLLSRSACASSFIFSVSFWAAASAFLVSASNLNLSASFSASNLNFSVSFWASATAFFVTVSNLNLSVSFWAPCSLLGFNFNLLLVFAFSLSFPTHALRGASP